MPTNLQMALAFLKCVIITLKPSSDVSDINIDPNS
jgi:hypothetical protein